MNRSISAVLTSLVASAITAVVLLSPGAQAHEGRVGRAPTLAAVLVAKTPVEGEKLLIEWKGSLWPGSVVALLKDGRAVVHYDGWGEEWDEVVRPTRLRRDATVGILAAGSKIFVEWHGSWWPARVRATHGEGFAISYDGYGAQWDETVPRSRIKLFR